MIDFGLFEFAAAPRTGTTWILHAAHSTGIGEGSKTHIHKLFPEHQNGSFRVSLVRHPCFWLASYFAAVHPGFIEVPCVDIFRRLPTDSFDDFIRVYLETMSGEVGRMFGNYSANSFLRVEDFPWAFAELLEAFEIPWKRRKECLTVPKQNVTCNKKERPKWNPVLWKRVVEAEKSFMESFDYHG